MPQKDAPITLTHMPLVPLPVDCSIQSHHQFSLHERDQFSVDPALRPAATWWLAVISNAYGINLEEIPAGLTAPLTITQDHSLPPGGYALDITEKGIVLCAADLPGGFHGLQTLRQLAGPQAFRQASITSQPMTLPHSHIRDHPRFPWRAVLLDVARHFLPKSDVFRFIELAALHHLNIVQLHLTDDQGWRCEILRYPKLTHIGSWRTESTIGTWRTGHGDGQPHGGYYTRDDLLEMVAYAHARGVTLVPEIDLPGHSEAAIAAYPWLGTDKTSQPVRTTWGISTNVVDPSPDSVAFFCDVLDEILEIFDSPWIAIGGDEAPTTAWQSNPDIVRRAHDLGFTEVSALHGWFLAQVCEHVIARGRRPIVWDEGLSHQLPSAAIVAAWRGWQVAADAVKAGYDVIITPEHATYLDHRASADPREPIPVGFVRTVADVYAFEPWPEALGPQPSDGDGKILGVQANVWTEHLPSMRRIDYAAFPRLCAFAEVAWSIAAPREPGSPKSQEFLARLRETHLPRLDAYGVEYRPMSGPHPWHERPGIPGHARDLAAELAAGGLRGLGGWAEGSASP